MMECGDVSLERASFSECTSSHNDSNARTRSPLRHTHARTPSPRQKREKKGEGRGVAKGDTLAPKGRSGLARPLSLSDALPAHAFPPQLAQRGGGMYVYNSGDVALESARFVECTSGSQAVPRAPSTRGCTD